MSNITLSFEKDGSDRLTHNVPWGEKRYAKWDSQNFGVPGPVFGSSSRGSFYGGSGGMCTGHNHERLHFFGPNLQGKALPKESKN